MTSAKNRAANKAFLGEIEFESFSPVLINYVGEQDVKTLVG